jgi:hypothetical protein
VQDFGRKNSNQIYLPDLFFDPREEREDIAEKRKLKYASRFYSRWYWSGQSGIGRMRVRD